MSDTHTEEQRRNNMRAIKSKSKLEDTVCRELWKKGFRFRRNDKKLLGKPDISIKKYKAVIFIDSCFWHGCEIHGNIPKSNRDYWVPKLKRNKERDIEVNTFYKEKGWNIKRIWEHDVKKNLDGVIEELAEFIEDAKIRSNKQIK